MTWAQSILTAALLPIFLLGCAAHRKALDKAYEYESAGLYVQSAYKDLEALEKKPDFDEALVHLRQIAPKAYGELLAQCESLQASARWLEAIASYQELRDFLQECSSHRVVFETVDVAGQLIAAQRKGEKFYYDRAEELQQRQDFKGAARQFENVWQINPTYRDTKTQLWRSYVILGDRQLESRDFGNAVNNYQQAAIYAADRSAADSLVAEAYYQWGESSAAMGSNRAATEKFEQALAVLPSYKDAEQRADAAYAKAVHHVAILPFFDQSGARDYLGSQFADRLLEACHEADLRFADFIPAAGLDRSLSELTLSRTGHLDKSLLVEIGSKEGIHDFVAGEIIQLFFEDTRPEFVELTHEKITTQKDSAGKKIEVSQTIYYREYTATRTLRMKASVRFFEVATGRYLDEKTYTEKLADQARWISYQGSIYDLPKNKQNLLDAPQQPRPEELMVEEMLHIFISKMSRRIVDRYR